MAPIEIEEQRQFSTFYYYIGQKQIMEKIKEINWGNHLTSIHFQVIDYLAISTQTD